MKIRLTLFVAALALLFTLAAPPTPTAKAFATLVVDDNNACPGVTHNSIQAAVNAAAPGDTIKVCAGTYNESVNIPATLSGLTLEGAQAGVPVAGRVFGSAVESTVNGQVDIRPVNVRFDGFSLTRSVPSFAAFGIIVRPGADGAVVTNTIIDTVFSPDPSGNGTAQAIYLENGGASDGADNVSILGNRINNVQSNRSAKGVLIGVNGATNPSQNTLVKGNTITNVTSLTRGAYGISVANAPGVSALTIQDNTISNLLGGTGAPCPPSGNPPTIPAACGWAHAIGLEGDTPGVVVDNNDISNLAAATPDKMAVWFEANPSFPTAEVHDNNFNVDSTTYGIAVHPGLAATNPSGLVDGTCNWWNSANGPGPVGPGSGALVSPNVTFSPWQTSPDGACVGPDADNDGITDDDDNCPNASNPGQENNDGDAQGDVCDADDDNDTVPDAGDNCQFTANTDQANNDGDARGDVCDPDDDNDGVADGTDNCQFTANTNQANNDGDSQGDVCDADDDNDGVNDGPDNCDLVANPGQQDTDNDGIGDACDPCPNTPGVSCPVPANKDQCKNGGWQTLFRANGTPFKNQGDCIQYTNTGK